MAAETPSKAIHRAIELGHESMNKAMPYPSSPQPFQYADPSSSNLLGMAAHTKLVQGFGHRSEGGWWRARSLTTGHENYIPEDCVAKVYHGWLFEGLGREKAEELLQLPNTKTGSFMIRKSETTKGLYSLSVRHVQVKHYRIFRLPNHWYYISPRQTFQCLEDLVNHYSEVSDGLCCVLTAPCLAQHTSTSEVRNQEPPVVMRSKNFSWKDKQRSKENDEDILAMLRVEDSGLSYGLRDSIASYLALTSETDASYVSHRKKKSKSLIYRQDKQLSPPPFLYHED